MAEHPLETWHRMVRAHDPSGLIDLLAEDAVFYSPVVHTPQQGRRLASWYLTAAFHVFFNPTFRYVREIVGDSDAMLEFETEIDEVLVNGVDLIKWNESGQIVEFKVMLRPLKAINLIHQRMAAMAFEPCPPHGRPQLRETIALEKRQDVLIEAQHRRLGRLAGR